MIIKLLKVKDVEYKGFKFKEIVGQKEDGTEYSKRVMIGKQNTEILNKLNNFGSGQFIKLSYDSTQFKNVANVESADGFPEKSPKEHMASGSVRRTDGTSRGEDTNRSAAIYLAHNVLNTYITANKEAMSYADMLSLMMETAKVFHAYIASGDTNIVFNFPVDGTSEDPLDPPVIE